MKTALGGIRILDMAGVEGQLCGRLLADLGAEVIKIEPPQGDPARRIGPFRHEAPDDEASLRFLHLNTNKKSVTLDLTTGQGRETFRGLVRTADAIIETSVEGAFEYESLRKENPALVVASITGFGPDGPYSCFKAPSIVVSAMGGVMYLCGSPERAPLAEPEYQPYQLASTYAAFGLLMALRYRESTGLGQRVDVSCQEVSASQQHVVVNYSANRAVLAREGNRGPLGGGMPEGVYPGSDGFCHIVIIPRGHWHNLLEWMGRPEALMDPIWENRHIRNANLEFIEPQVLEFMRGLSKDELFRKGQEYRIPIGPINRPDEFTRDPYALERGLFVEVEDKASGRSRLVCSPFRMSETPGAIFAPAPGLGEHYEKAHTALSATKTPVLSPSVEAGRTGRPGKDLPLQGIRVLDFTFAIAGPVLTQVLGENGAEVIKVESEARQQRGRARADLDPKVILQQRVTFADVNRNKRSVTVNMGTKEGREVIRRLVPICDVVVENFSPRVMKRWGLGYEELKALRKDIIMARLPAFGLSGFQRDYLGMASVAMSITGLYHLWSYPDDPEPAGPPVWTPNYLSAAMGSVAIMAALRHRDRTGEGQLIELAQTEAMAAVLGTEYLDYFVNGTVSQPLGNRHAWMAPHGVYRCKGSDAWCAIAIGSEEEWEGLCRALGSPAWCRDARFGDMAGRHANQDELDQRIEEWTWDRTPETVMDTLQKAGVPAGVVQDGKRIFEDPNLRSRGFFTGVDDPAIGLVEYPGPFIHLSETPSQVERCHRFGEDNDYVFSGLLNMSEEEIRKLQAEGVLA